MSTKITSKNKAENIAKTIMFLFALVSIFTTIGIVVALFSNSITFFRMVSVREFLFNTKWTPLFAEKNYGVLPLIVGTLLIALLASIIALPIGLFTAIYLSEYANPKAKKFLKPILELLAGIPSIVYGFFALTFITPILKAIIPGIEVYNALSASIAMGFMIMPMVASLSEDAMTAVPNALRNGGYAMGLTKFEIVKGIVIPYSLSGIMASFVLAISRAVGETMIVALAAGAMPSLSFNPLKGVLTLTGYIAQVSKSDVSQTSASYYALYAVGLVLFILTLSLNYVAKKIIERNKVK
ncbi:phosphate ABC transporter permease subunit PstC [Haloplasma contractile]|uniref:Phosphate transport system permease protein n=1 Tax=Haloplasma contractile SSD-17B TaxID=1033810 RepID=F7PSK2_9MOLU|nr:phosphate ABC transporter permease subunit PstC [Haloplasma contractile]ERJ12606.1 Phosphate ABC transporter permease protein PstC [Haloplasma contractile SSD-17B]